MENFKSNFLNKNFREICTNFKSNFLNKNFREICARDFKIALGEPFDFVQGL